MTLDNLVGTTLERIQSDPEAIQRLLLAAERNLTRTIGLDRDRMIALDALRKQRNVSDYSGDPVPASAMKECIASAEALFAEVKKWLEMVEYRKYKPPIC